MDTEENKKREVTASLFLCLLFSIIFCNTESKNIALLCFEGNIYSHMDTVRK